MMKKSQQGMTTWQLMGLLVLIGFAATVLVKVGPSYMDNRVATSALDSIKVDLAGKKVTDREIKGKLSRYFQVNMVSNELTQSVKINRVKRDVLVSMNYEVRNNLMANIDVVVVFKNEVNLAPE